MLRLWRDPYGIYYMLHFLHNLFGKLAESIFAAAIFPTAYFTPKTGGNFHLCQIFFYAGIAAAIIFSGMMLTIKIFACAKMHRIRILMPLL